jgi:hypothetical protein
MTKQPRVRITEFLSAFFPDENESICLRSFKPKGAPKEFAVARNLNTTRRELLDNERSRKFLLGLNDTSGIYFIVNFGGHSDEEITRYNAFFVENDNLTIAEQGAALDAAPIKPSVRVETSKSIHAYWLAEGDCTESEWREIQARLIAYFDGDRQNKNPSRCMRLPGFDHLTYNGDGEPLTRKKVEVREFHPERRYTVAEMLTAFPAPEPEQKPSKVMQPMPVCSPGSEYSTWEELNGELKRRVMQEGRKNSTGNYEMRCPAHHGQGETSLFYNPESGAVKCMADCSHEQLLRAFGLPEKPQGRVYGLSSKVAGNSEAKQQTEETAGEKSEAPAEEDLDVCMADVVPEEVEWLVKPYIPLGALTIVEGDPDEGKSFATLAIAAALTNGSGLPFGEIEEPGNVLLLSAEDGRANTIRPRLDSLGADVTRIFAVTVPLAFDEKGFKNLEDLIEKRQPKMVLFDPVFAYVGGKTNINSDNKVRDITTRLSEIAEKHRCALVALRHLSKAEQRNAKMAGGHSIAWTAAARSVLLFGHEPGDEQSRGFVHTKHNLSKKGVSQGYRIEEAEDGKPLFQWTGECELTSDKILVWQKRGGSAISELERAEDFLFVTLQGGAVLQKEVERRAKRSRITPTTLRRAKTKLEVISFRNQSKGAWWWKLPDAQSDIHDNEHVSEQASNSVEVEVMPDTQSGVMSM